MPISIRELSIKLRGVPENLSPVEQKSCELRHLIELQEAMFRVIGLQSIEQAWLHIEPNRLIASARSKQLIVPGNCSATWAHQSPKPHVNWPMNWPN